MGNTDAHINFCFLCVYFYVKFILFYYYYFFFVKQIYTKVQSTTITKINKYI